MIKIFFKTTADFNNTGEVLIYKSLLEFLRNYGEIIVNDDNTIDKTFLSRICVQKEERLSSLTNSNFLPYMLRLCLSKNKVALVTGVGDHKISNIKDSIKNILSFNFLLLLRLFGLKIIRIGASMSFNGRIALLSEKLVSIPINHYYVRDSISYSNCLKAGVKKCKIAPDLSWGYSIKYNKEKKERECVYMTFRPYCDDIKNNIDYKEHLTNVIIYVINALTQQNYKIVLCYQCLKDYEYMQYIYKNVANNDNVQLLNEMITLDNADKYYCNAKFILSNRLHCLLLGYKFDAPTICLTDVDKHKKIVGIFNDNNISDAIIDIKQPMDKIVSKINSTNLLDIEARYRSAEQENKTTLQGILKDIFY